MIKVRRPGRKTSGFWTIRIWTICRTSGPEVMSDRIEPYKAPWRFPRPLRVPEYPCRFWDHLRLSRPLKPQKGHKAPSKMASISFWGILNFSFKQPFFLQTFLHKNKSSKVPFSLRAGVYHSRLFFFSNFFVCFLLKSPYLYKIVKWRIHLIYIESSRDFLVF